MFVMFLPLQRTGLPQMLAAIRIMNWATTIAFDFYIRAVNGKQGHAKICLIRSFGKDNRSGLRLIRYRQAARGYMEKVIGVR